MTSVLYEGKKKLFESYKSAETGNK